MNRKVILILVVSTALIAFFFVLIVLTANKNRPKNTVPGEISILPKSILKESRREQKLSDGTVSISYDCTAENARVSDVLVIEKKVGVTESLDDFEAGIKKSLPNAITERFSSNGHAAVFAEDLSKKSVNIELRLLYFARDKLMIYEKSLSPCLLSKNELMDIASAV